MASKISLGGDFTATASWAVVDATSLLDSEAGNTALTTSYVSSANFAPGAIEVDGIAIKLASRAASPSETITINLRNVTDSADVKTAVINVADLPTCVTGAAANEGGWIFFKFDAPTTLTAAKNYCVQAKTSAATQVNLYRDATAGNWSRLLRTTTTEAPAAGDQLDIMGEHTGAGTGNDFVITMDNTLTTDFGSGTDGSTCIAICKRATLNFAYAAATAYYLKLSGNLIVYNGGTLTIGTVANPIPRDGTAVLEFDPVADGGMGLICRNGSTFTAQGLSRTVDKNVVSGKLILNTVNSETHFHLDTDSGWLSGDTVGIASTSRTYSQCETKILSGAAGAEIINVTVAFGASVHSGISPTQAEVILLTRNVKVRAVSSTIVSYCNFKATATIDIDWVEFYWMGEDVATKRGIYIETTTGSCNIQYSSLHDFEDEGVYITGIATNNITFSNNITYNLASLVIYTIYIAATSGTAITFDNNILMLSAVATNCGFYLVDIGGTFTNNTVVGMNGAGFYISEAGATIGTFNNNTVHSCAGIGIDFSVAPIYGTISNSIVWRNSPYGIEFKMSDSSQNNLAIDTATLFGNTTANIMFTFAYAGESAHNLTFKNITSSGDTSFATTYGIHWLTAGGHLYDIYLFSCSFGVASGIKTAHTTDINFPTTVFSLIKLYLNNCILASATEIAGLTSCAKQSFVKSTKHDQTTGANLIHKSWFKYGTIITDLTVFNTAVPSMKMTPNSASYKLESGSFKVNVNSGQACTPTVYVRESVVGDGTDYNGARIRLILKRNDAIGITADTVLATATVGSEGAFEALSAATAAASENGVMEFVVDCDGTTGWINVDDFSATVA